MEIAEIRTFDIRICMNRQGDFFDWNQARAFLATAEAGSFSAAARKLGLTQPTLGRQVAGLEASLGLLLFERIGKTLQLTESGMELLEHFRAMGDAALQASLAASGRAHAVTGRVSITATDAMAAYGLPDAIKRIADAAPGIQLELLVTNEVRDLLRREADIAVRHVRPQQEDLVARLVRESTAHLYAASSYLDERGRPNRLEDLGNAAFVGFAPFERFQSVFASIGLVVDRRQVRVVTDNGVALGQLIKRGVGIGVMTREMAAKQPGIECVLPDLASFPVPTWLTTHRELQTSKRIRVVFDLLAEALS